MVVCCECEMAVVCTEHGVSTSIEHGGSTSIVINARPINCDQHSSNRLYVLNMEVLVKGEDGSCL
jgi:hypothetical protein